MRVYMSKAEASRVMEALQATSTQDTYNIDTRLVSRIQQCMKVQKPFPKNLPDEAGW